MGSGSGLPGIIVAICDPNPVVCIESKLKKRAFLTQAKNALELSNLTMSMKEMFNRMLKRILGQK